MRIIGIGDVHGCLTSLENLIDQLKVTDEDTVVFLGDYVDRGPQSVETVQYVLDFQEKFPNTVLLRGNHDEMMIRATLYNERMWAETWWHNGGTGTVNQYKKANASVEDDARKLEAAADYVYKTEFQGMTLYFAHAGFYMNEPVDDQYTDIKLKGGRSKYFDGIMWNRQHISAMLEGRALGWGEDVVVICGHTPLNEVLYSPQLICVDTGAVFGGNLSAVVFDDESNQITVAQVPGLVKD